MWLGSSSPSFAQLTLPQSAAGTNAASVQMHTPAQGQALIDQARAAMAKRDFQSAVGAYRKAATMAPHIPQLASGLAKLRLDLQIAGIDSQLLQPVQSKPAAAPKPNLAPLPDMIEARPMTAAAPGVTAKQTALQLMAIGKAALDRGDVATALGYARQAQALNVPEKDFAPGEPRVWQFVLDAESAARRSGVMQASAVAPVAQASAPQANPSNVAQTVFQGNPAQAGAVQQVQAEEVITEPLPYLGGNANSGEQLYQQGVQALSKGDRKTARERFAEAWKYEAQLPLNIRAQLKDKLTLLAKPTKLPSTSLGQALPMTDEQKAEMASREAVGKLYREVTSELAQIAESSQATPLDSLDELNRLRRRVMGAEVDLAAQRSLVAQVDRALTEQKKYIEANRAKIELDLENDAVRSEIAADQEREIAIDDEISTLVDQFNDLIEERRFQEAEVIAKAVQELKPGSPIATSMFHMSRMGTRRLIHDEIRAGLESTFVDQMNDIDRVAVYNPNLPYEMPSPRVWRDLTERRARGEDDNLRMSAAERAISRKMESAEVNVKYKERPLNEVLSELSAVTSVPIVMDNRALAAIRVTPDSPVNLEVSTALSLKSALNLILRDLELTYVIDNDVLNITSVEAKQSKVYPETYRVADLVTPIPNFTSSYDDGLAGALRAAYQMTNPRTDVQIMPVSVMDIPRGAAANGGMGNPNMLGQYNPMGSQGGFGPNNPPGGGRGGGSFADFQSLIDLIQTTVVPDTWEALGGPSTMAPYPQNLSLVISTTSDVHDQIADLLESLRALQNLQITIEVRFITLSDTFFEQIGVDFDVQFDDNVQSIPDDDSGSAVTIGFDGISGLPTPDLDIRFENNSFGVTSPFGAPDAGSISSIGFAILSDIEAFFFLQAAQGDNRNNVMQAPKVTLFDGQFASIQDFTQRPFVTSITPVVGDFAVAQQPVIVVLNEGTQLNVQGIVSDDKRFVRLTLVPFFSQIGDVDEFTFEGQRSTNRSSRTETGDTNGDGVVDDNDAVDTTNETDFITGTTVQLPTFAFTQVSTTVSVPDGGTILLGGIKRLAEGRAERGVPMLSKIPYLSRLFRNTAVGSRRSKPDDDGDTTDHHSGRRGRSTNRFLARPLKFKPFL